MQSVKQRLGALSFTGLGAVVHWPTAPIRFCAGITIGDPQRRVRSNMRLFNLSLVEKRFDKSTAVNRST